ncbi:hypothetical protein A6770_20175 [Nostoc minutum NIES-26]|uniref:Uncharacterized protein n=1 Tax=Nostoc minutum NIES-26 TaxID=1844469 RepID=A0A367R5C1_9NOSO|nr:hypothetical protein A6770_20175 [Nostoc minutum NIES-26]
MSDNKQQSGFWKSLPGVFTALGGGAGIAAIIAAVIQVTHPSTPAQSNTPPANAATSSPVSQETEGKFTVAANSSLGKAFVNKQSSIRTFHFVANKDKWTYNSNLEPNGADGNINYSRATQKYNLPGFPEGSLIVRQKGEYHFIGHEQTLTLDPNETVFFTINDTGDNNNGGAFNDNQGYLTIEWNCEDCK